ncbi:YeiH family protein [Amycolatopsis aidingensis]|uniref:YeiH family protein n=1 Tax=Amycolatopsis aidingensis TaxID=2842453 RepID=UPI001C0B731A|nr:putative sulfate exporter family transporter [Amycolatopsis aidingensis]
MRVEANDTGTRHAAIRPGLAGVAPGLVVALLIAAVATIAGRFVPVVGGPVFGILLGATLAALVPALRSKRCAPGYAVAAKPVLQLSIVVLGTGLSLRQVVQVGGQSLPVMLGTLAVALGGAWLLGNLLGVRGDARTLIGVGTGICGASAIAATSAVLKPKDTEVAYALGTIFTCNIAAVLLFPPLGHLMGMSPEAFGLWSGTAINDTSSVVAAAYGYGGDAGSHGMVVKLTRTLMLIPIVLALAALAARRNTAGQEFDPGSMPWRRIVPPFLIGFLLAVAVGSLGVIPGSWHPVLSASGTFLITTALAGIGLGLRPAAMRAAGHRPLLLGVLLWLAVAMSSLVLQAVTGNLT